MVMYFDCCICSALYILFLVLFYVLFVCKYVLYYCHRVSTQLQLRNTLYHISYHISCVITSIIEQVCSSGVGFDCIKVVPISSLGQNMCLPKFFSWIFQSHCGDAEIFHLNRARLPLQNFPILSVFIICREPFDAVHSDI